MRNVLFRCASLFAASMCGAAFVPGCAADGTSAIGESITGAADPTEPMRSDTRLPPSSSGTSSDGGAPDAGTADAAAEAGPPAPIPGQPCSKLDEIFKRACGACGTQTALCFAEDGGAGTVSDYGPCAGEVVNGCVAGTTEDVACGNCGMQKKTCDKTCKWSTSSCAQPPGACKAGTVEHTTTGCPAVNTYRQRSCSAVCSFSAYTACAAPANETVLEINGIKGQIAAASVQLSADRMSAGLPASGACPAATLVAGDYPYAYVEIKNTTLQTATVAVYTSVPAGGTSFSRVLAGYKVPFVPADDAARLQCAFGPTSSTMSNIGIAPGTSVLVYVRSWYAFSGAAPQQSTGAVNVTVRTDNLL